MFPCEYKCMGEHFILGITDEARTYGSVEQRQTYIQSSQCLSTNCNLLLFFAMPWKKSAFCYPKYILIKAGLYCRSVSPTVSFYF